MQTATAPPSTNPSVETVRELYEQMVLIRGFETEAERQYKAAEIGGYCHVASGQEAVTVVPLPYAKNLETAALPGTDRIEAAILSTVGRAA